MLLRSKLRIAPAMAVALFMFAIVAGVSAKPGNDRASGGKAVAHRQGKVVNAPSTPTSVTYSIGGHALEPTLGVDKQGDIFYAAAGFDSIGGQPGT